MEWASVKGALFAVFLTSIISLHPALTASCTFITSNDRLQAHCSHRRQTKFPRHATQDLHWIDLSFNFVTSMKELSQARFRHLRHLNVSHNYLTSLPDDSLEALSRLNTLDVSYNDLGELPAHALRGLKRLTSLSLVATGLSRLSDVMVSQVPRLVFLDVSRNALRAAPCRALRLLRDLQSLRLSHNPLTTLPGNCFAPLSRLTHLQLINVSLARLQPLSFRGLQRLRDLELSHNSLELRDQIFPVGVFRWLRNLQNLALNANDYRIEGDYPQHVFLPLTSLSSLSIDTFREPHFGVGFSTMSNITSLTLGENGCNMYRIKNDSFEAFHNSTIQSLKIYSCGVVLIETCAFCYLPHLSSLIISDMYPLFSMSTALRSLYGVQNQTLRLLDSSGNRYYKYNVITDDDVEFLVNVCVEKLVLRSSKIVHLSAKLISSPSIFLRCLKHVDFFDNAQHVGYRGLFYKAPLMLSSIETIEINNQAIYHNRKDFLFGRFHHTDFGQISVTISPSLRKLNVSKGLRRFCQLPSQLHIINGGNVSVVDISYCGAYYCHTILTGVSSLRELVLSGNYCPDLNVDMFRSLPFLQRLGLADLELSEEFLMVSGVQTLRPLAQLRDLDLSLNALQRLPYNLLRSHSKLRVLRLHSNRFQTLPVDLSYSPELRELDLRHNLLHVLSPSFRQALQDLAAHHPLSLLLRDNPLSCTCRAADSLTWLATTDVILDGDVTSQGTDENYDDNGRDYPCVSESGDRVSTGWMAGRREEQWRGCVGLGLLTVSIGAVLTQLLALLTVYLLWGRWSFICHAWRVLRHLRTPQPANFTRDALFVSADADVELTVRFKLNVQRVRPALRVAVPLELVVPGLPFAEQLAHCMEESWKVVLVVTQAFPQDMWSGFTAVQAQGLISDAMPHRVILLYVGRHRPVRRDGISHVTLRRLLQLVPESNVYHVSCHVTGEHPLWSALAHKITE